MVHKTMVQSAPGIAGSRGVIWTTLRAARNSTRLNMHANPFLESRRDFAANSRATKSGRTLKDRNPNECVLPTEFVREIHMLSQRGRHVRHFCSEPDHKSTAQTISPVSFRGKDLHPPLHHNMVRCDTYSRLTHVCEKISFSEGSLMLRSTTLSVEKPSSRRPGILLFL
jgi:hypothetical protein